MRGDTISARTTACTQNAPASRGKGVEQGLRCRLLAAHPSVGKGRDAILFRQEGRRRSVAGYSNAFTQGKTHRVDGVRSRSRMGEEAPYDCSAPAKCGYMKGSASVLYGEHTQ